MNVTANNDNSILAGSNWRKLLIRLGMIKENPESEQLLEYGKTSQKRIITDRIKAYLADKYGNVSEGIRKLGKDPNSAYNSFLSERKNLLPNGEFLCLLAGDGANMNYILNGVNESEVKEPGMGGKGIQPDDFNSSQLQLIVGYYQATIKDYQFIIDNQNKLIDLLTNQIQKIGRRQS